MRKIIAGFLATAMTTSICATVSFAENTDGIQSNNTLYFMIRDDEESAFNQMEDEKYWKLKLGKKDSGKYIKKISDVTKIFSEDLYNVKTGAVVLDTGKKRHRYVTVELAELYTDDEIRLGVDMVMSPTQKAVDAGLAENTNAVVSVKNFHFYLKNLVRSADNDWEVGVNGLMLTPVENDWNNVTYYDEDGDVAHIRFFGDSDIGKFSRSFPRSGHTRIMPHTSAIRTRIVLSSQVLRNSLQPAARTWRFTHLLLIKTEARHSTETTRLFIKLSTVT